MPLSFLKIILFYFFFFYFYQTFCYCCLVLSLFYFLSKIFSFLTGLSFLLGPSGFWHLALPVGFAVWNVIIIIICIRYELDLDLHPYVFSVDFDAHPRMITPALSYFEYMPLQML